ncbi:LPS export ABC transporter periplasmic protein LptC [Breznakiellaceae bacterium SP9]
MRTFLVFSFILYSVSACSFDYGGVGEVQDLPDIIMDNVAYARVRNGDLQARFTAEKARRYEKQQSMELEGLSFEQYEKAGTEQNAVGTAGSAVVELESGNFSLTGGVRIDVESEDYTIQTQSLDWKDKDRLLSADSNPVTITKTDGTNFIGHGFSADLRNRTWVFDGGASGFFEQKDDEKKDDEKDEDEEAKIEETDDEPKNDEH